MPMCSLPSPMVHDMQTPIACMLISEPFRVLTLEAIPDTAIEHGLHNYFEGAIAEPSLTPSLTMPVFSAPAHVGFDEVVAIVFRDARQEPVHGGLYTADEQGVIRLVLSDRQRSVRTDDDPAWTAFGLAMAAGVLLIKGNGMTREVPWSIIDCGIADIGVDGHSFLSSRSPTSIRVRVFREYMAITAPLVCRALGIVQ